MANMIDARPVALVYTTCAVIMGALWFLAYWRVPPMRRELVWLGLVVLPNSILLESTIWTVDWWRPPSIFPWWPPPTPTDFLYGFFNNSLMSLLPTLLIYRLLHGAEVRAAEPPRLAYRLLPYALITVVPFVLFWAGRSWQPPLHSCWATMIAVLLGIVPILVVRPDLAPMCLWSGITAFVVGVLSFQVLHVLFAPTGVDFVAEFWKVPELSGRYLGYGPIEDLAWYGYTGAFLGIYYKFWHGTRVQAARPALQLASAPPA